MSLTALDNFGVVILSAGKGTRLNCQDRPKVMLDLAGRPIVSYIVETLRQLGFTRDQIVLVVGFQENIVRDYFGDSVSYATQSEQKGTAHAAYTGMIALPSNIQQVLVLNGDDSAFYQGETILDLLRRHADSGARLTLLTTDHTAMNTGKIVRHATGEVEIIEKEYLTEDQKKLTECSTGTFVFERAWFERIFPVMPPLRKLREYGLPTALAMARDRGEKYQIIKLSDSSEWFGINTPTELAEANELMSKKYEKK